MAAVWARRWFGLLARGSGAGGGGGCRRRSDTCGCGAGGDVGRVFVGRSNCDDCHGDGCGVGPSVLVVAVVVMVSMVEMVMVFWWL